jgi:hypothetical protein
MKKFEQKILNRLVPEPVVRSVYLFRSREALKQSKAKRRMELLSEASEPVFRSGIRNQGK